MLFEELYDSVMRRHRHDAGNTTEKEGQAILARVQELLGGDTPKSGNESSAGGCDNNAAQKGIPSPLSAESSASTAEPDIRFKLTVMSNE